MNFNGEEIAVDSEGYLKNCQDWDEALALELAKNECITLTELHWEVIYSVRDFYMKYNTYPAVRMLVKIMAQKYGEEKGNSRYLFRLFPEGPTKQATKISGLPKPAKCL